MHLTLSLISPSKHICGFIHGYILFAIITYRKLLLVSMSRLEVMKEHSANLCPWGIIATNEHRYFFKEKRKKNLARYQTVK